jgi:Rrf2 family transcriptional regulator, cysteine metabolism repressor
MKDCNFAIIFTEGMRLSRKSEYACLALIEIAGNSNHYIKNNDISRKWDIPEKFLEQILLKLKKTGYLKSKKGKTGGYQLTKSPSEISIADIIRLFDGPLAPVDSVSTYFYEISPVEKCKSLHTFFKEIRDVIAEMAETKKLSDFLSS